MSTEQLADRLIYAKQHVPFVQANLIEMEQDDLAEVERFRERLMQTRSLGKQTRSAVSLIQVRPIIRNGGAAPDDRAWERALDYYLDALRPIQRYPGSAPANATGARACRRRCEL